MNENFIEKINDIVFDTLARRCSVYIEAIGSLVLSSENVLTKINGKIHSYPYYKVTLVKGERFGIDLKAHCLSISGVDKKNIELVFKSWLAECGINNSPSRFTINGVVAYGDGVVKMSDGLNKSLNPLYVEPHSGEMSVKKSKTGNVVAIVSVVSLVVMAVAAYFILYQNNDTDMVLPQNVIVPVVAEVEREAVVEEAVAQDTVIVEPITNVEAFYIIAGVFSTKENAEKSSSTMKNLTKDIIEVAGKFYITIGKYNTEQEAIEGNRKYPEKDYWVLNVKNNKPIYK